LNFLTQPDGTVPVIPVSWGELVDRLTILEIKEQRLNSAAARSNVRHELSALKTMAEDAQLQQATILILKKKLRIVNRTLWNVEDQIRAREASQLFDEHFIQLARSVYINNDKRASLKRQINEIMKSDFGEQKQYFEYSV
jgi:Family of unknown function (DUF6165)